ncbi:DUF2726 domain-containing protein [Catenuloplanes atrovinosus]|uniref:DUF2726 domain-containing protein n=1 Tax=Catenuloplanes atrovinosus TaxID=137266 RepID=A0AAE3YT23_9ACTN|nr:DUF2726 domain-containing protein [Catenuloplanes atrovinosus]MDR7278722.1 hypothetical protein [Catenuloplanes atrovinosus]
MSIPSPLRPVATAEERLFARGRWVVQPDQRLSQLVARRPEGVSPNQWNTALRTRCDFVALDPATRLPVFAVEFADPAAEDERLDRMLATVCGAVGLEWLRIVSPIIGGTTQARRTVEYLIDARAFRDATAGDGEGPGFRDIVGRLPDGRDGFVNDLSTLARAAAVDAYVGRDLADPIIRGLHVSTPDGAEGWAWVELPEGRHLLERVRLVTHGFDCGIALDRLAEDLAALAVGERLKRLEIAPPVWLSRDDLVRAYDRLQGRHPGLNSPFFAPL